MGDSFSPPLFIGMPVYNGGSYLAKSLESLIAQSFVDWELLISDNGSIDNTKAIALDFVERDSRIRYVSQPKNFGAVRNFIFLLEQCKSSFFMWAAADDLWEQYFLERCIGHLQGNPKIGMAFTGIRNIDQFGRQIRAYPDFFKFSGRASFRAVRRFLLSPEIMGKANLIYSVYRTDICREAMKRAPLNESWGSDMAFVLAAISLSGVWIDHEVLFSKRIHRESEKLESVSENLLFQSCPLEFFSSYKDRLLHSVKGTRFWPAAYWIMNKRFYQLKKMQRSHSQKIIVKLIGGLGNQMFQYAMGRALADRHHVSLKLDLTGFKQDPLRKFELGEMQIRADIATKKDLKGLAGRVGTKFSRIDLLTKIFRVMVRIKRPLMIFREKSFLFDPEVNLLQFPIYLEGYWQSERYFLSIADHIRHDFRLGVALDEANEKMHEQIMRKNAVSIHIRRGDYVSNPASSQYHGVCSMEFYRDAITYICARVESPHFFVFSDDHLWVADNLVIDHPLTLVQINGPDRGLFDLALMKSCRHHIIANSSFSWWGAWLNPSPDKIVVAPKRWFNQANQDTRDLLPESWIKL